MSSHNKQEWRRCCTKPRTGRLVAIRARNILFSNSLTNVVVRFPSTNEKVMPDNALSSERRDYLMIRFGGALGGAPRRPC